MFQRERSGSANVSRAQRRGVSLRGRAFASAAGFVIALGWTDAAAAFSRSACDPGAGGSAGRGGQPERRRSAVCADPAVERRCESSPKHRGNRRHRNAGRRPLEARYGRAGRCAVREQPQAAGDDRARRPRLRPSPPRSIFRAGLGHRCDRRHPPGHASRPFSPTKRSSSSTMSGRTPRRASTSTARSARLGGGRPQHRPDRCAGPDRGASRRRFGALWLRCDRRSHQPSACARRGPAGRSPSTPRNLRHARRYRARPPARSAASRPRRCRAGRGCGFGSDGYLTLSGEFLQPLADQPLRRSDTPMPGLLSTDRRFAAGSAIRTSSNMRASPMRASGSVRIGSSMVGADISTGTRRAPLSQGRRATRPQRWPRLRDTRRGSSR